MEPAVFNKSAARALFSDYYAANKPAVKAVAEDLLKKIQVALNIVRKREGKWEYDPANDAFNLLKNVALNSPIRSLLYGKALHFTYATAVEQFAKQCSDASIPNAGQLTLQYCQAKLLKRSGAASIEEYVATENDAFLGTGFVNFLQKVIHDRYFSSEQKAEIHRKISEVARAKVKEEMPNAPEQYRNIDPDTFVYQPSPTVKLYPSEMSFESFDEVTFNGKLFALVCKAPPEGTLHLNLPQHRVIVLNPLVDCTFSIKAAEVYLLSKLGNGKNPKLDGTITSTGLGVDFCRSPENETSFVFKATPYVGIQGGDRFAADIAIKIGIIFDVMVQQKQRGEEILNPITDIAHMLSHALPFDYVKTRLKLPEKMTEVEYKAKCIHTNVTKLVCDFFEIRPSAPL